MRDLAEIDRNDLAASPGEGHFALLDGEWMVAHRRRRRLLDGCEDWESFLGRCVIRSLLDGRSHVEEHFADTAESGERRWARVRLFDPLIGCWSAWTVSEAPGPRLLGLPTGGGWTFRGEEPAPDRTVKVRQLWLRPGPHSIGWSEARSIDGGRSWETGHVMELTRIDEPWSG